MIIIRLINLFIFFRINPLTSSGKVTIFMYPYLNVVVPSQINVKSLITFNNFVKLIHLRKLNLIINGTHEKDTEMHAPITDHAKVSNKVAFLAIFQLT